MNEYCQIHRRAFLRNGFAGFSAFLGLGTMRASDRRSDRGRDWASNIANLGPLQPPDVNGVMLPHGFVSRVVARSGQPPVASSTHLWHDAPDGGAVFSAPAGGWVYVSNSEMSERRGGVSALLFDSAGAIVNAYSILSGTLRNCAGGRTPWGTWLSCEEIQRGRVFECDPLGLAPAVVRPALGRFRHEAAAVDPVHRHVYLTEDEVGEAVSGVAGAIAGRLYRFTPLAWPDLGAGQLEVAEVTAGGPEGPVVWHPVPDPSAAALSTREQVPQSTPFHGGEGIDYYNGVVCFATKGDDRVWRYDTATGMLTILYEATVGSALTGVDNLEISAGGDVLVAEDNGDLQIVAITPPGQLVPVMQLVGHDESEVAGVAFDPNMRRLYFSSQRGPSGSNQDGMTFEITGPFGR